MFNEFEGYLSGFLTVLVTFLIIFSASGFGSFVSNFRIFLITTPSPPNFPQLKVYNGFETQLSGFSADLVPILVDMSAFNLPFFMEFLIFGMVKTVWKFFYP